jgi:hypothetical protein
LNAGESGEIKISAEQCRENRLRGVTPSFGIKPARQCVAFLGLCLNGTVRQVVFIRAGKNLVGICYGFKKYKTNLSLNELLQDQIRHLS